MRLPSQISNGISLCRALLFRNKPVYVHYGITHRCNLACRMCNIKKSGDETQELAVSQIDRLFDILRSLGVVYVSIGGGEPLLRKDLAEVLSIIKKKGFMFRLLTNGLLAEENLVRELASAGLREISLSLDTLDPSKQDSICGAEGSWDKINRAIELFSANIPRARRRLLINTVVSPLNIEELADLSCFARKIGWGISFIPAETNACADFSFQKTGHEAIDKSYARLLKLKNTGGSNIFNSAVFLKSSRDYLKSPDKNWRCNAGALYFSINPRGEFSVCHRFDPEADILRDGFKDFFESPGYKLKRRQLSNSCPGCMRPCWAEVSFFFNNPFNILGMSRINWNKPG